MRRIILFVLIAAVFASPVALAPPAARSQDAGMVQYAQTMWAVLPDGSASTPYATIITKSAQRERFDSSFGTSVFECDLQRSLFWRVQDKTYTAVSFQEMSRQYAAVAAASKANGQSESSASVHDTLDAKTAVIDGITADHLVEVLTLPTIDSLGSRVDRDVWYAPNADPFRCPALDGITGKPGGAVSTQSSSSSTAFVATGSLEDSNAPPGSLVLRESDSGFGPGLAWRVEVTSMKNIPYDPSFFDPPAGFAQVSPRPFVPPTSP